MVINESKREEFDLLTDALIEWMSKNCHQNTAIIVNTVGAELLEGVICNYNGSFLKD